MENTFVDYTEFLREFIYELYYIKQREYIQCDPFLKEYYNDIISLAESKKEYGVSIRLDPNCFLQKLNTIRKSRFLNGKLQFDYFRFLYNYGKLLKKIHITNNVAKFDKDLKMDMMNNLREVINEMRIYEDCLALNKKFEKEFLYFDDQLNRLERYIEDVCYYNSNINFKSENNKYKLAPIPYSHFLFNYVIELLYWNTMYKKCKDTSKEDKCKQIYMQLRSLGKKKRKMERSGNFEKIENVMNQLKKMQDKREIILTQETLMYLYLNFLETYAYKMSFIDSKSDYRKNDNIKNEISKLNEEMYKFEMETFLQNISDKDIQEKFKDLDELKKHLQSFS